jgi:hypothetical protein
MFKGNDDYGMMFSHQNDEKRKFYIKTKYSKLPDPTTNSSIKMLTSYLSEDLDYSTELESVVANSTLSSDYLVKNIMFDSMEYWASNFTRGVNCQSVQIIMNFKLPIIIKTISIYWVKPPFSMTVSFCTEDNICNPPQAINEFNDLRTRLSNIYLRSKYILIDMAFDNSRTNDFYYECFCSILRVAITKNEIKLKPFSTDSNEINSFEQPDLFTDNFLVTKTKDLKKSESNLEILFDNSIKDMKRIKSVTNYLKNTFVGQFCRFSQIISNLKKYYDEYSKNIVEKFGMFFELEDKLRDYVNIEEYEAEHDQLENISDKKNFKEYKQALANLWKIRSYVRNLKNIKISLSKLYANSLANISKMKVSLNNYLDDYAIHFSESYTDQYIRDAIYTIKIIGEVYSSVEIYNKLFPLENKLNLIESAIESLKQFTIREMSKKLKYLSNKYNSVLIRKSREYQSLMDNFQIVLQNLKLIKPNFKEVFLNMDSKCKPVQLITNSLFDDVFIKLFVTFTRVNVNEFDSFIIKFNSKNLFFYLKYNSYKIEVWKKKYEEEEKLFEYNKLTTDYDQFAEIEDFSKLFYILIKIYEGKILILLRVEYKKPPLEILEYLDRFKHIQYEELLQIYEQNENDFEKYYGNSTLIYEKSDQDLKLAGHMGLDSYRNSTKILIAADYPEQTPNLETSHSTSLNIKFPYGYITDTRKLKKTEINNKILNLLSLDPSWIAYDTEFLVLTNFYFKYELSLNKNFGENFISNPKINNLNSAFLQLSSLRSPISYYFEIVSIDKGFILKIFKTNIYTDVKTNIFRKNFSVSQTITFILVKIKESLQLQVKRKSEKIYKTIFTIQNFHFVKFFFLLNPQNIASISSIYFSDTYGGSFVKVKEESNIKTCTKDKFENFVCHLKDKVLCKRLFCKSCCTKKLRKSNIFQYQSCFEDCVLMDFK